VSATERVAGRASAARLLLVGVARVLAARLVLVGVLDVLLTRRLLVGLVDVLLARLVVARVVEARLGVGGVRCLAGVLAVLGPVFAPRRDRDRRDVWASPPSRSLCASAPPALPFSRGALSSLLVGLVARDWAGVGVLVLVRAMGRHPSGRHAPCQG
jgi:hypothetical protein